jgi:hypothetical protein
LVLTVPSGGNPARRVREGKSLRPTSLAKLVKLLKTLSEGPRDISSLARSLGLSERYVWEQVRVVLLLGLARVEGDSVLISDEGRSFLERIEARDADYVDKVLLRLDAYRRVKECLARSLRTPSEVSRCADVSVVTADIAMRLVREVESLRARKEFSGDPPDLQVIGRVVVALYERVSRLRMSRYVPISELAEVASKELNIDERTFYTYLRRFCELNRGMVLLTTSPSISGARYVDIGGRKYTHIALLR